MKKIIFLIAISILSLHRVSAQQDHTAYKNALHKMITASGGDKTYTFLITQIMNAMKQRNSTITTAEWDRLKVNFPKKSMDLILDKLTPIYQKHFSLSDINQMTAFYQSPIGRKFAEKTPLILQESMMVGRQWNEEMKKLIQEEMKKK